MSHLAQPSRFLWLGIVVLIVTVLLTSIWNTRSTSTLDRRDILSADDLLARGQPAAAIAILERVPQNDPLYKSMRLTMAKALQADGQWQRAAEFLTTAIQEPDHDPELVNELRWMYFNLLRPRDVQRILEQRLQAGDVSVLPELLDSEYRRQVPHEAIKFLESVQARHPSQPLVMTALGTCMWRTGQLQKARDLLESARRQAPQDVQAQVIAAEFFIEQGHIDAASNVLTANGSSANASLLEEDDRIWWLRSLVAEQQQDLPLALQHIERAQAMSIPRREYFSVQSSLLRRLNRSEQSTEAAQRAAALSQFERDLQQLLEANEHRNPSVATATRLQELCHQLGKHVQSQGWQRVAEQLQQR